MKQSITILLALLLWLPVAQTLAEQQAAVQTAEPGVAALPANGAAEERMQAYEERYRELKQRAGTAGVILPERPPWQQQTSAQDNYYPGMQRWRMMQAMTPEQRNAYRMQHYQQRREQARRHGIEMPETPPWMAREEAVEQEWQKHKAVIEGMSDEERAACRAMHQRQRSMHRGQCPMHGGMCKSNQGGGCQHHKPGRCGPMSGFGAEQLPAQNAGSVPAR